MLDFRRKETIHLSEWDNDEVEIAYIDEVDLEFSYTCLALAPEFLAELLPVLYCESEKKEMIK